MKTEKSYFEILSDLYSQIESDPIPANDKKFILDMISRLLVKLYKYSY